MRPYFILVFIVVYYYSVEGSARLFRSNHVPHLDGATFLRCKPVLESADENVYFSEKERHIRFIRGRQDHFLFDLKSNQSLDLFLLILDLRSIFFKIKD
jgi:hypothetical protein